MHTSLAHDSVATDQPSESYATGYLFCNNILYYRLRSFFENRISTPLVHGHTAGRPEKHSYTDTLVYFYFIGWWVRFERFPRYSYPEYFYFSRFLKFSVRIVDFQRYSCTDTRTDARKNYTRTRSTHYTLHAGIVYRIFLFYRLVGSF